MLRSSLHIITNYSSNSLEDTGRACTISVVLFEIDTYGNCGFWSGSKLTNLYGTHICVIENSQNVR